MQKPVLDSAPLHQVTSSWSPYHRLSEPVRARLRKIWNRAGFNPDVASKVRYEVDMLLLRARCATSWGYRRHAHALSTATGLRIHLGCGNALFAGWLNVDCYPPAPLPGCEILTVDLRQSWPIGDESTTALFSEHFLEHLPMPTVRDHVIPEIYRVLEPGGVVRLGVPNGEYFVEQYMASRQGCADPLFETAAHGATPMIMLNDIAHGFGHYFVWDFDTMRRVLERSGFVAVKKLAPGVTGYPVFADRDRLDPWRNAMTLYVEAERPR